MIVSTRCIYEDKNSVSMGFFVNLFLRWIMPLIVFAIVITLFVLIIKKAVKGNTFQKHLNKSAKVVDKAVMRGAELSAAAT